MWSARGILLAALVLSSWCQQVSATIIIEAHGQQNVDPDFWTYTNNSGRDLVRVELDLPGDSHRFDPGPGVIIHETENFDPANVTFSFPGDNGDNLRAVFNPGTFRNNAKISFYADVDEWVSHARDMSGISVTLEYADGTTESDVFKPVDYEPYMDFRPDGTGAAFVTEATLGSYDEDDFVIAGAFSRDIAVFDSVNFTYKGPLTIGFDRVRGLDFDLSRNVVAVSLYRRLDLIDPLGNQLFTFTHAEPSGPVGVAVGVNGHYYVATQYDIQEFDTNGMPIRTYGTGMDDYKAVVFLPGNKMLAAGGGSGGRPGLMDVFDVATEQILYSFPFDNGQQQVQAMHYDPATGTVLFADNVAKAAFERTLDGAFVRRFDAPAIADALGITRGPGGDVFVTDASMGEILHRWHADGTYVTSIPLSSISGVRNILWTGSTPSDCNTNGVFDAFEIAAGTSADCNRNAIPDECDIVAGTSQDCEGDGIPNDCVICSSRTECDDCDAETADACIQGVCVHLPECSQQHAADLDGDGDVDLADYAIFALCVGGPDSPVPDSCPFGVSLPPRLLTRSGPSQGRSHGAAAQ